MQTITLTITLSVPEGTTVEIAPQVVEAPKMEETPAPMIMFSQDPDYPEWGISSSRPWTDEEADIAADTELSDEDVADLIGRTKMAVTSFRMVHNLRPRKNARSINKNAARAMARWTKSEIEYVRKNYNGKNAQEIGQHLGRSKQAIQSRAHGLGL